MDPWLHQRLLGGRRTIPNDVLRHDALILGRHWSLHHVPHDGGFHCLAVSHCPLFEHHKFCLQLELRLALFISVVLYIRFEHQFCLLQLDWLHL